MIAATIRTGAPNTIEKMIPTIGIAMRAPSSTSKSLSRLCLVTVTFGDVLTLKCRFSFRDTLCSMESSSSGVTLAAGATLAPALAATPAVAEAAGEGAGVGVCPNAAQTSAAEQRQVRIVNFIVVLWE